MDVENDILEIQDLSSSDGECEDDGRGGHKQKTIYIYIYNQTDADFEQYI